MNVNPASQNQTSQTKMDRFLSKGDIDTSWQLAGRNKKRKVSDSPEKVGINTSNNISSNHPRRKDDKGKPISTSNRFASLADLVDGDGVGINDVNIKETLSNTANNSPVSDNDNKRPRPPPIFIHNVVQITGLMKTVEKIIAKDDYRTTVLSNNTVRVNVAEVDDYRVLVRELRKINVEFYTYQLKSERAFKVVIRQLHSSIQPAEVKAALEEVGFNCRNVSNIRHWRTKEPLPLFFVDLEPDEKAREIYQLRSLLHMQIKVESPRPQKVITQCHRCQQYGHTKAYCALPEVCVKCSESHSWDKCTKLKEEKPRCGLCGGEHTANYKGCPVYKKLTAPKASNVRDMTAPNTRSKISDPVATLTEGYKARPRISGRSYVEALKNDTHGASISNGDKAPSEAGRIEELLTRLINQNETMMQLLQTVILKLLK